MRKDEEVFDYNNEKAWFIVHTKIGYETMVKESIERLKETRGLDRYVFEMFIPVDEDGKKIYPGYLFMEAIMTNETWFIIRNTKYVFGFIGSSGKHAKPIPVTEAEVKSLKIRSGMFSVSEIDYVPGNKVKILSGPFEGIEGTVEALGEKSAKVNIIFCNKDNSVDVELGNLEKVEV